MKRTLCCLLLVLVSCSAPPTPAPTAFPSETAFPTVTPTSIPTETEIPTATPTSTSTPSPTITFTPRSAIHSGTAGSLAKAFQTQHPDTHALAFAPDSTWLLIGSGEASRGNYLVGMWWPDQNLSYDLIPASATVWDVAFSPDGKWAAYVAENSSQDFRGHVIDVESKKQIASFEGSGTARCLAFSPDGTRIALGGQVEAPNGKIWLYDTSTWELIYDLPVQGQNVLDLVFSPDGTRIYSSGDDGRIRIWNSTDKTLLDNFQKSRQAKEIALSPDGSFLASTFCTSSDDNGCIRGGVAVWRTADGKSVKTFDDIAQSVAFSPDGSLLVTGGDYHDPFVRIRYTATWELIGTGAAGMTCCLAFSGDGRLLAGADYEDVMIWTIP